MIRMYEKRALVTAGSTWTKVDDVRAITNIFTGVTGISIAKHFAEMGIETTVLYNPKINTVRGSTLLRPMPFVTFDDLESAMEDEIASGQYDIVVHSAAVSDYGTNVTQLIEVGGYKKLEAQGLRVFRNIDGIPGKIKSDLPELTITMGRTRKIVDQVKDWDPAVFLVKFKLEVGRDYPDLLAVAEASRLASRADLIVANDLRGARSGQPSATILGSDDPKPVEKRKLLPSKLYNTIQWEMQRREGK